MTSEPQDVQIDGVRSVLDSSELTAFYLWLLISFSAAIIMAQDTWLRSRQPRLNTIDATAAFTKVLVIHSLWLLITIAFLIFAWRIRPHRTWWLQSILAGLVLIWTLGVLIWSARDVQRLQVTTWRCTAPPTENLSTDSFLATCDIADVANSVRIGNDIFLWSADNDHFWRWIVPGDGSTILQLEIDSPISNVFLGTDTAAPLTVAHPLDGSDHHWFANFDARTSRNLQLYIIDTGTE